jgi:ubiquinol-cytochrome c reductase iron-sulfur subunit
MADSMAPHQGGAAPGETRRDFLMLTTGAFAAVGVGAIAWPFIHSMNPARDVLALASTEVDLSPIAAGQAVTVVWRGKPVFVRHRTAEEIQAARATPLSELKDPAPDQGRVQRDQWLIVVGVCPPMPAAISAAGSAPATAAITTRRGAFVSVRRRRTLQFPNTPSPLPRRSASADGARARSDPRPPAGRNQPEEPRSTWLGFTRANSPTP